MLCAALRDGTEGEILYGRERRQSGNSGKGSERTEKRHDGDGKIKMDRANDRRLAACMDRARLGGELTIGFLGGSITQRSLAEK